MRKFIKYVSLSLVFVLVLGMFVACGKSDDKEMSEKVDKIKFVASWMPNNLTLHDFEIMKDCGFDVASTNVYQAGYLDSELYDRITGYILQAGLENWPHLENAGSSHVWSSPREQHLYDDKIIEKMSRDGVNVIQIFDEPVYSQMELIGSWIEEFERYYPDTTFFCNLFPAYATISGLGADLKTYVQAYCDKVLANLHGEKWLSVDYYPYLYDHNANVNAGIYNTWLYNLEVMRYAVEDLKNAHLFLDIMTCSMYSDEISWRVPTIKELRQQIYVGLCYGFEGFGCYTYGKPIGNSYHPSNTLTMIDPDNGDETDDYKTQIWYDVQQVIREIKGYDGGEDGKLEGINDVYLKYEYDGTKTFVGSESYRNGEHINENFQFLKHQLPYFTGVKSVYTSQDTVISQFHNSDGKKAFIIVNFADTAYNLSDRIIMEFDGAKSVTLYNRGASTKVNLHNGILDYNLDCGDGCIIIPE